MVNRDSKEIAESLAKLRRDYRRGSLDESALPENPFLLFDEWLSQASAAGIVEPNAMVLATVDSQGCPSARTVLLKEFGASGFSFFTNYESQKGRELAQNPRATAVFLWTPLEQQIRITGAVEKLSREASVAYFKTRPREAQLAAASSPQSKVVSSRAELEAKRDALKASVKDGEVECPVHWGGYRLRPELFEFWQGRPGRLHDRICYRLKGQGWERFRLAP